MVIFLTGYKRLGAITDLSAAIVFGREALDHFPQGTRVILYV